MKFTMAKYRKERTEKFSRDIKTIKRIDVWNIRKSKLKTNGCLKQIRHS